MNTLQAFSQAEQSLLNLRAKGGPHHALLDWVYEGEEIFTLLDSYFEDGIVEDLAICIRAALDRLRISCHRIGVHGGLKTRLRPAVADLLRTMSLAGTASGDSPSAEFPQLLTAQFLAVSGALVVDPQTKRASSDPRRLSEQPIDAVSPARMLAAPVAIKKWAFGLSVDAFVETASFVAFSTMEPLLAETPRQDVVKGLYRGATPLERRAIAIWTGLVGCQCYLWPGSGKVALGRKNP